MHAMESIDHLAEDFRRPLISRSSPSEPSKQLAPTFRCPCPLGRSDLGFLFDVIGDPLPKFICGQIRFKLHGGRHRTQGIAELEPKLVTNALRSDRPAVWPQGLACLFEDSANSWIELRFGNPNWAYSPDDVHWGIVARGECIANGPTRSGALACIHR